jgi:hypothetical protein
MKRKQTILATAAAAGPAVTICLAAATRCLGVWQAGRFHHLAQALIPLTAAGIFLGLSTLTVSQLHVDGIDVPYIGVLRAVILALATLWTIFLAWQVAGLYAPRMLWRALAVASLMPALAIADAGWFLLLWGW